MRVYIMAIALLLYPSMAWSYAHQPKWEGRIDLQYKMGNKRAILEYDSFLPLMQSDTQLLFADMRFQADDDRNRELGMGLGVRRMFDRGYILGAYGFIDRLHTQHNHSFYQLVTGLEAMTERFELRGNLYFPEDKKEPVRLEEVTRQVSGNSTTYFFESGAVEKAHPGFDAEFGVRLPINLPNLWLYGGGFHFHEEGFARISGPRLRLEMTIDEMDKIFPKLWMKGVSLSIGGEVQHDRIRETQGLGLVRLSIPLGALSQRSHYKAFLSPLEKRMMARVIRDVDIVTNKPKNLNSQQVPILINGTSVDRIVTVAAGDGAALLQAVAAIAEGERVMLLVSGDMVVTTPVVLKSNTVLSGPVQIQIDTPLGRVAENGFSSGSAKLTNTTATGFAVTLAQNAAVKNMQIDGGGTAQGIQGTNANGVIIENVTVSNSSGHGIVLTGCSNAIIRDSTLNTITTNALQLLTGTATVSNVSIDGARVGMNMEDHSGTVSGCTVTNITHFGMVVNGVNLTSETTIQNNSFIGTMGASASPIGGAVFLYGDGNISVQSNTFNTPLNQAIGIYLETGAGDAMVMTASGNSFTYPKNFSAAFSSNRNGGGTINLSGDNNTATVVGGVCVPFNAPTSSTLRVNNASCF